MRHCAVDGDKHHLSSPRAAPRHTQGGCTGWKQWLPPDKVRLTLKDIPTLSDYEILSRTITHTLHGLSSERVLTVSPDVNKSLECFSQSDMQLLCLLYLFNGNVIQQKYKMKIPETD